MISNNTNTANPHSMDPVLSLNTDILNAPTNSTLFLTTDAVATLTLNTLSQLNFDKLQDLALALPTRLTPSSYQLYTADQAKQVQPVDYHYDFLNHKRTETMDIEKNPMIDDTQNILADCLKRKIKAHLKNKETRLVKGKVSIDPTLIEEAPEFKTELEKIQNEYNSFVERKGKKQKFPELSQEFFDKLTLDPVNQNTLKQLYQEEIKKNPNREPKEILSSFSSSLFIPKYLALLDLSSIKEIEALEEKIKNKDRNAFNEKKKLIGNHLKNIFEPEIKKFENFPQTQLLNKQKRVAKRNELYKKLEEKYQDILTRHLELQSQDLCQIFNDLSEEHQKHSFQRFINLFSCHSDYIEGIIYFLEKIEKKSPEKAKLIKGIICDMISKTHLKDDKLSTGSQYYRDLQGRNPNRILSNPNDSTQLDKEFDDKVSLIFPKKIAKNQFHTREDAHTMPFPGAFSWNNSKLKENFTKNNLTYRDRKNDGTSKRVSKEAFCDIRDGKIDKLDVLKNDIDQMARDLSDSDFMQQTLQAINGQALVAASETETMPFFINHSLDSLSETKHQKGELKQIVPSNTTQSSQTQKKQSTKGKSTKTQTSTRATHTLPLSEQNSFKKYLADTLVKLINEHKQVDFGSVLKKNEDYIREVLTNINDRMSQICENTQIELIDIYELYLMCDVVAAIENAYKIANVKDSPILKDIENLPWKDLKKIGTV